EWTNWGRSAMVLMGIGGVSVVNLHADILMLAAIRGSDDAGIYQVSVRGAELVAFALVVANVVVQPTISSLYAAGEQDRLQRVVTAAARATLLVALPIAAGFAVFGGPILGVLFGDEFIRG